MKRTRKLSHKTVGTNMDAEKETAQIREVKRILDYDDPEWRDQAKELDHQGKYMYRVNPSNKLMDLNLISPNSNNVTAFCR